MDFPIPGSGKMLFPQYGNGSERHANQLSAQLRMPCVKDPGPFDYDKIRHLGAPQEPFRRAVAGDASGNGNRDRAFLRKNLDIL